MHGIDGVTEQMIKSVLGYAEYRLRLDPVPLDTGSRDPAELRAALEGLIGDDGHDPDQVLSAYAETIAPAVISADSPRFLGFIPAAPTKAALLFDMLISCASIQGISWLEAAGAIHAENTVLELIADKAGLPRQAGGCFVSGGSAANLSALAVAREEAKRRRPDVPRWRVLVSADAHSSVTSTLRLLEMDPLVVGAPDHRLTGQSVVLFRRRGWVASDYATWARQLLDDQVAFMPPTAWEGQTVARFAFLHPHTTMDLVTTVLDRMA